MARRERYMEEDVKVGSSKVNKETGEVTRYKPSKEDSIERLSDKGTNFQSKDLIEEIICDKAMLSILQHAMKELDKDERELINDIYYKNLTTREVAEKKNISQPAIVKRHKKLIEKLRKYFL